MAKKSKTQRARASARRAERREGQVAEVDNAVDGSAQEQATTVTETGDRKNPLKRFRKPVDVPDAAKTPKSSDSKPVSKQADKKESKPKKAGFLKEVRAELKRVTWPSRQDVIRWSGVVVVALIFFSVFVFVLDNWVVTPLLLAISSLGA
jgi:preprotein translocase subunit SecE